jgi:hypothetical protein
MPGHVSAISHACRDVVLRGEQLTVQDDLDYNLASIRWPSLYDLLATVHFANVL